MKTNTVTSQQVCFIDKFFVPKKSTIEFSDQMNINRDFIIKLTGFVKDDIYVRTDENGNSIIITVAVWESVEALRKAKETVQAEFKKQGFSPAEMMERLNISMDRGTYNQLS